MNEITRTEAITLLKYGNVEVFGIDYQSESNLYYNPEGINDFTRFGVERKTELQVEANPAPEDVIMETFYINGYWKDDKVKFEDYQVVSFDDIQEEEDNIFFYGLSEADIIQAIELKESTAHEFVITGYKRKEVL